MVQWYNGTLRVNYISIGHEVELSKIFFLYILTFKTF